MSTESYKIFLPFYNIVILLNLYVDNKNNKQLNYVLKFFSTYFTVCFFIYTQMYFEPLIVEQ